MEKGCLPRGIPCIEFAIGSKAHSRLTPALKLPTQNKHGCQPTVHPVDNDIEIKPVNAKHFFWLARRKDHEGYMWVPQVLSRKCISKDRTDKSHVAKWCATTTSKVAHKDFDKFMSAKPEYMKKNLLKQVPPEYHSIIEVFMKSHADIMAEHQADWDHKIHLE